ncbi:transposase [Candidatus Berkelbacteria bacterium]|nr:transposase [Candidatus Berkelbacteria bacterium]
MPERFIPLATGEYYHIYNRGLRKQPTFLEKRDYELALLGLVYYQAIEPPFKFSVFRKLSVAERRQVLDDLARRPKLVTIICFCLMPNHFHLLLRQEVDGGISTFLRRWTNSYTRLFNTRHEQDGPLFQGAFKAVHVSSNEQLLHLSRYIHLNPFVSLIVKESAFLSYPWSSLGEYASGKTVRCQSDVILDQFKSPQDYLRFVLDRAEYAREIKVIEHLILEN